MSRSQGWDGALVGAGAGLGISLGLHEPRLRQVPARDAAHTRYARTIPTALAKITEP